MKLYCSSKFGLVCCLSFWHHIVFLLVAQLQTSTSLVPVSSHLQRSSGHRFARPFILKMSTGLTSTSETRDSSPFYSRNVSNYADSLQFYHALRSCEDRYISHHLNKALDILSDALRLYGPDRMFSSYNGGKDADVIMHLLRAVFAKYSEDFGVHAVPEMVYFVHSDEFDEVTEHIEASKRLFDLKVTTYDTSVVQGLKQHIKLRGRDSHCAFVLGTRRGDPNCGNQEIFAPSSSWMPLPFMRINPILTWDYGHVWHFLRTFNLPYCSLYDQGYTSLGKKSQTFPNSALLRKNPSAMVCQENLSTRYWPAYMLSDWTLERTGRPSAASDAPPATQPSLDTATLIQSDREEVEKKLEMDCDDLLMDQGDNNVKEAVVHPSDTARAQTAALLIIGDEILNGFTDDSNLPVAAKALARIGIPLKKASVVPDDIDDIAQEVQRLSQRYDILFTSGGIGPTHDDVTIKAIAKALHQDIRLSAEMLQYLETVHLERSRQQQQLHRTNALESDPSCPSFDEEPIAPMEESMRRLAFLPEQSKLRFPLPHSDDDCFATTRESAGSSSMQQSMSEQSVVTVTEGQKTWPILQCDNIFILPGIPQFFAEKMELITKYFLLKQEVQERWKIILDIEERALVRELDTVVSAFPHVKIGSYPYVEHPEFKTILAVEAARVVDVEAAVQALVAALPAQAVLRVERILPASSSSSEQLTPK